METTKQKECKENEFHNFTDKEGKLVGFEFQHDNYEDCSVIVTCQNCGMTAELQGDFQE